ncbi:Lysosomal amino acid transporter 1 [Candida viswanathii]|uniref:Lysosomal amino acid transporter 1 n=1 Tax=Candida viswanathii TaxID=5486 RepID=A0A367YMU9_9ASCO|nr:Lysosomal amino acid transporter 1 [Candida viswanathii]
MSLSSLSPSPSPGTDSHQHFLYYLSKSSSVISLTMWLFAQIPQIILNYRHHKVTLSVPFLLMVTISDLVNLGYQAVVKDHTYLILLLYSSILNVVIIAQYVYYAKYPKKPPTPQVEPPTLVNRILGSAFMVSPALCMTLNYQKENDTRMRFTLRESLSLSSSILYILLRVPQIQKNYRRKSTSGLSLYMILLMFFGNIFNLVSIASDPHLFKIYSHDTYLIGSLGTIVMDFVILCQFWK